MTDAAFDFSTGADITPGASRQTCTSNSETITSPGIRRAEAGVATRREHDLEIPNYRVSGKDLKMICLASAMMGLDFSEFIKLAPYLYARDYLQSNHIDPRSLKEMP